MAMSDPLLSSSQIKADMFTKSTEAFEVGGPLSPPWDDDDLMDFKLDDSLTVADDIEELLSCSPNSLRFESDSNDLFSSLTSPPRMDQNIKQTKVWNSKNPLNDPNISVCARCLEMIEVTKVRTHSCGNPEDSSSWSNDDIIMSADKTDEKFTLDSLDPICDIILENINLLESNLNVSNKQDGFIVLDSCEDLFGSEGSGTDQSSSLSSCDSLFRQIFCDSPNSIYPDESDQTRKFRAIFDASPIVSPGHCSVCKVCFQSPELLKIHQEEFSKKNICCQCKKKLENTSKLRNHWRKHNKEKPFQCNRCGKYYSQKNSLVRHQNLYCESIKVRNSQRNISLYLNNNNPTESPDSKAIPIKGQSSHCQVQNQNFSQSLLLGQDNLISEIEQSSSHNKSSNVSKVRLEKSHKSQCSVNCSTNSEAQTGKHSKDHMCKICSKDFLDPKSLENHKSMHQNRRSCCNCNKVMASKSKLMIHYRSHTKEFPFVCQVCSKSFAERSTLRKHISTHGEKQFHCDSCGKSFARKDYLTKHSLIHCQLYKCSQCTFQCHDAFEIELHLSQH